MNCVMNLRCFWNACHTTLQDFTEAALAQSAQFEPFATHKPSSRTVPPSAACGALAQIPDVTCYKLWCFFTAHTHSFLLLQKHNGLIMKSRVLLFSAAISQHVSSLMSLGCIVGDEAVTSPSHVVFNKW